MPHEMIHDWSNEETDNPLLADEYNFCKVEKWTKDGAKVERMLYAGNDLERAHAIFTNAIGFRPRIRWTLGSGRGSYSNGRLPRSANENRWPGGRTGPRYAPWDRSSPNVVSTEG